MTRQRTFTDRFVKSLTPRDTIYEERERDGFGIRVLPTGSKSWFYTYESGGKRRRIALGRYPAMRLKEAREAATALRMARLKGKDPRAEIAEEEAREAGQSTIRWLADEFVEKYSRIHKRTWKEDERILQTYVLPIWGERAIEDVRRTDVVRFLDDLVGERGMKAGANRVFSVVRKMFNWAVERGLVDSSPCHRVKRPAPERQVDRVLSEAELITFWHGLETAKMAPETRQIFKFQLLTAARVGEVAGARWDEIDLKAGWWTLPAERSKNGLSHRVPLSDLARRQLEAARVLNEGSECVFPSKRTGGPMTIAALARAISSNLEDLGIVKFTPHDLRRSAASHMASRGVPRVVIARILNHIEHGVTAVYDRHSYDAEKREALEAWGKTMESIVAASIQRD